jgi:serine/threonine protein kinase/tetratricopeptide (TPR) repeat protein
MGDYGRPGRDQEIRKGSVGGEGVKTPSSPGGSSADLPPPDAPTLVPETSPDSGTHAPVPPLHESPADSPTLVDVAPLRRVDSPQRASNIAVPSAVLQVGSVLAGRYEIIKTLGEGGMGAVYKAKDLALDRLVALKVIRPELAKNPAIIDRFKQELLLSHRVTHRNVIRIYDLGEGDGVQFITMEYIEGKDLRSLIHERRKFPPREAVEILEQVCLALDAAHSVGIIHRDLKPQNIMIDDTGRVLVMDFGLARTLEGEGMTQTGALVGTMEYMSPEQALAQELDQRSDLFSAGLILFEMLTGQVPFKADSAIASLLKRTRERAIPISDIDREIPGTLSNIVSRCLERDPNLRYQTSQEVLQDLRIWLGKGGSSSKLSASSFILLRNRAREIPWKWVSAGAVMLMIAIGSAWYVARNRSTSSATQHAAVSVLVADFQNATLDPVFDGTLEPAFNLALEGASFITTFSRGDAHKIASDLRPGSKQMDEALARLVAMREQIPVVVSGSIVPDGKGYKISARAVDTVTGKVIDSQEAAVDNKDQVLHSVGKVAATVRRALGDATPESTQILQNATYSSGSIEATHEYALGKDLEYAGKWEQATTHYERAIQLDPEMGRAYAALGDLNANMGRRKEGEKYYQMAMARFDRMSDREKYRTRAEYFLMMREPKEAVQQYEALIRQYPGDTSVYANLALAYFYERNMPMALQEGRKAVQYAGKSLIERNNLALYAIYAGDFATGEKEAQAVIQQEPSYLAAHGALAMALIGEGKLDEARKAYEGLSQQSGRGSSMAALGQADLDLYQGRPDEAADLLRPAIEEDNTAKDSSAAAVKLIALGAAQLLGGKNSAAADSAEKALALDKQESTEHAAGLIFAAAGQLPKASSLAAEMEAKVEPEPQLYGKLLEAEVALKKNDLKKAISLLKEAQQLSDTWVGHFTLSQAYLQAGAFPEADSEIEECLKRRGEASAIYLDDLPTFRYVPAIYYYLGRVQERLKNPAAAESYRTFLSTQEKGVGPLVTDARKRLASH